jgi:general stress protein YciG
MKKEAYYFSHDANARNDVKLLKVRRQLGAEGYAIYFMIIEVLREQSQYKLPLTAIADLAYDFDVSEEKVKTLVCSYDLFQIEEETFFSSRLLKSMEDYNQRKTKYIEAGRKGGQASVKHRLINPQALKERKGKESKGNIEGVAVATKPKSFKNWTKEDFLKDMERFRESYEPKTLNAFYKHWIEPSASGKMKLQLQPTWDTSLRLQKWISYEEKYKK